MRKKLLLFMDAVQDGHFRTGKFQSFNGFWKMFPAAKSFARRNFNGQVARRRLPIGAFWVRCAVRGFARAGRARLDVWRHTTCVRRRTEIFEIIEKEKLDENARKLGAGMLTNWERLAKIIQLLSKRARPRLHARLELVENIPAFVASDKSARSNCQPAARVWVMTIPLHARHPVAAPLNLKPQEAAEGISKIEELVKSLA